MGGQVSAASSFPSLRCGNANADWMTGLCPQLWDVPLHHLSFPGGMLSVVLRMWPSSYEGAELLLSRACLCAWASPAVCDPFTRHYSSQAQLGAILFSGSAQHPHCGKGECTPQGRKVLSSTLNSEALGSSMLCKQGSGLFAHLLANLRPIKDVGPSSSSTRCGQETLPYQPSDILVAEDQAKESDLPFSKICCSSDLSRWLSLLWQVLEGAQHGFPMLPSVVPAARRASRDTLTEISEWLEKHPREVVPLACRNFQGLSTDLHKYLVTCIQNIFGDMLCPRGEVPTLRLLWARSQQVIIFYEDEDTMSRHRELSPGVCYWWGNKVKVQELIRYLEGMKSCGRPGGLFVAGIKLMENLEYILVHPCESLQKMTVPEVPYLSTWVRAQCPGLGSRCTNVIAGDFIGADSFVSDVIRLNEKLLWC
ncbi:PI-PLC X domain-containing protein 1-like [Cynocephalus volans]|uniref:PI-PLC X domain-containing protein 1-like n=1 Tax=Cynocephalus volans TaxID=110931 RepID=UPI002FCACAE1